MRPGHHGDTNTRSLTCSLTFLIFTQAQQELKKASSNLLRIGEAADGRAIDLEQNVSRQYEPRHLLQRTSILFVEFKELNHSTRLHLRLV